MQTVMVESGPLLSPPPTPHPPPPPPPPSGEQIHWMRAARTDKGVSAVGQVVSFKMVMEPEGMLERINAALPSQVGAQKKEEKGRAAQSGEHCSVGPECCEGKVVVAVGASRCHCGVLGSRMAAPGDSAGPSRKLLWLCPWCPEEGVDQSTGQMHAETRSSCAVMLAFELLLLPRRSACLATAVRPTALTRASTATSGGTSTSCQSGRLTRGGGRAAPPRCGKPARQQRPRGRLQQLHRVARRQTGRGAWSSKGLRQRLRRHSRHRRAQQRERLGMQGPMPPPLSKRNQNRRQLGRQAQQQRWVRHKRRRQKGSPVAHRMPMR